MKKVIVVEDVLTGRNKIADVCRTWLDELDIYTATNTKESVGIIEEENVDLIIYDLSSGYGPQIGGLEGLTSMFPYIPCLAITDKEQHLEKEVLDRGASFCLMSPPDPAELKSQVFQLLEASYSGAVRGIPVHSLLQVLEIDEKTCTLKVKKNDQNGMIFLEDGSVIGAQKAEQYGQEALYTILAWEDATTEIRYYNGKRPKRIEQPLISLILEAFRQKDEKDNLEQKFETNTKTKPERNQLSTVSSPFSLEIGSKIDMEVEGAESPFICEMVGMVPDKFLIVTVPKPVDLAKKVLQSDSKIILKYIHMGRICLSKTKIIDIISSPQRLLFLKYPAVVHFNELRKAKRTSILVPSTIKNNGEDDLPGMMLDLSSMGCLFTAKVNERSMLPKFDIDSGIELACFLPGVTDSQLIHGKVKNMQKSSTELRLGIEFASMDEKLKFAIERYVQTVESMGEW